MSTPVNPTPAPAARQLTASWTALATRSRQLLRTGQDPSGAWPASPDFTPYGYCWFRDGSFIADGASAAGLAGEAAAFHDWCQDVLTREEAAIARVETATAAGTPLEDSDYLPARYALNGERHDDDWWNFQVDGYGTWLWALARHLRRHPSDARRWSRGINLAVRYVSATGLGTCRDWWEENRDQTHIVTLAGVASGLRAALEMAGTDLSEGVRAAADRTARRAEAIVSTRAAHEGRLVKWVGGTDLDASLLSVSALYDVIAPTDPRAVATAGAVEKALTTSATGPTGVHRYEADTFYGGGQWPVLACLLATHHLRVGSRERARQLIDWVVSVADSDLLLPEQVSPRLAPEAVAEWEERWGPSAHPLLWSHGAFLSVVEVWGLADSDQAA